MTENLEFPDLLRLIDERSVAFRAAVASAPSLDAQVPTCPEWTVRDLVEHLGGVHRRWAANVAAGPADGPSGTVPEAPKEPKALLAWSAESTEQLLRTLREFGPDRDCWTWWGGSQSPQTSGAVARHQVQEASVHTYDAQITLGASQAQPLPEEAALDGVDEFLSTCCAGTDPGRTPPPPSTTTPPKAAPGASHSPPTAPAPPVSPQPLLAPTPPSGARPVNWSWCCTAGSRSARWRWRATETSSNCFWPGIRAPRRDGGGASGVPGGLPSDDHAGGRPGRAPLPTSVTTRALPFPHRDVH